MHGHMERFRDAAGTQQSVRLLLCRRSRNGPLQRGLLRLGQLRSVAGHRGRVCRRAHGAQTLADVHRQRNLPTDQRVGRSGDRARASEGQAVGAPLPAGRCRRPERRPPPPRPSHPRRHRSPAARGDGGENKQWVTNGALTQRPNACAHLAAAIRQRLQLREGQVTAWKRDVRAGRTAARVLLLAVLAAVVVVVVVIAAALDPPGGLRLLLLQQRICARTRRGSRRVRARRTVARRSLATAAGCAAPGGRAPASTASIRAGAGTNS